MDSDAPTSSRNIFPFAVAFEGGLAFLALGLGWLMGLDPTATWPRTFWGTARGLALGTLCTLPLLAFLWVCVKSTRGPFAGLLRTIDATVVPLFRGGRLVDLAMVAALAGLGEELLFRGIVQQAATDWFEGNPAAAPWIGLAVAALLFGLAHSITPGYALFAGLIGLYLGAIWRLSGDNLLVPMVAHASYDFLALVYLVRIRSSST